MSSNVEIVKSSIKLSQYVERFASAKLKPNGTNKFRTCCPLHGGDNPTGFMIDDNLGLWYCYTGECGGGSIIDYWMKANDKEEIGEAIEGLAAQLNVTLPERSERSKPSRRRILDALATVADECNIELFEGQEEDSKTARRYLRERGIKKGVARRWQIGFLPSGLDAVSFIREICKDTDALVEAGVLNRSDRGTDSYWAPMNGRLMFPIMDGRGDVVGFSARKIPDVDCSMAGKYVNSVESSVYHKSSILYGMHNIQDSTNHIIVAEGQLDAIAITESNKDENPDTVAVAACGTAINKGHLKALSDAKTITEVFDGDLAGKKAIIKSIWTANELGERVNAVILDDDQDPWELYLERSPKLTTLVDEGMPLMSVAVEAQWEILDRNEFDMTEWVKSIASQLSYTQHRDQIISDTARIIGQSPSSFKRSLALPTDIASKRASKGTVDAISPQTRELCLALMAMGEDERDGILAGLRPWSNRINSAVNNWLPVSSDMDTQVIKKLALGIDAPSDSRVDRIVASLMESSETVDLRVVLRGMAKQILSAISSVTPTPEYLASQVRNIRRSVEASKNCTYHSTILAYLVDSAVDLERAMYRASKSREVAV